MKKNIAQILAAFALLVSSLCAEPVKVTRAQASELYVSLASSEAGLTPTNAIVASDNLNALRPVVEALDKARAARDRKLRSIAKVQPADAQDQAQKAVDDFDAVSEIEVTVTLKPMALTDDEVKDSKLKPIHLSVVRRWLLPPEPKK